MTMKRFSSQVVSALLICTAYTDALRSGSLGPSYCHPRKSGSLLKGSATERDDDRWFRGAMAPKHNQVYQPTEVSVFDVLFDQKVDGFLFPLPSDRNGFVFPAFDPSNDDLKGMAPDLDTLDSCGEDCEPCLIPDEYKQVPEGQVIDVMAFLGIQRAQPVRPPPGLHTEMDFL